MNQPVLTIRYLGRCPYLQIQNAMHDFTAQRSADTRDEIWLLEHDPVYTQGQAGKAEHLLHPNSIPVVQSDRGGQITYHGPGQLIVYFLIDIKRKKLGVRELVSAIEMLCIDLLAQYQIQAYAKADAPGVYVGEKKIASLGLRIRRGCSFHGLALNIKMDLSPFAHINPCGYPGLAMTQTSDLNGPQSIQETITPLIACIQQQLIFEQVQLQYH